MLARFIFNIKAMTKLKVLVRLEFLENIFHENTDRKKNENIFKMLENLFYVTRRYFGTTEEKCAGFEVLIISKCFPFILSFLVGLTTYCR
jgi:hypothetical protein